MQKKTLTFGKVIEEGEEVTKATYANSEKEASKNMVLLPVHTMFFKTQYSFYYAFRTALMKKSK
jgi:hypothetical protein